jgi:phosphoenolpyruvate-protein kinase (PTS system EI component)
MLVPLLVGFGVDELSAGAARVGVVRRWVRRLSHDQVRRLGSEALTMRGAEQVESLVEPVARELRSVDVDDALGEDLDGGGRLLAFGT